MKKIFLFLFTSLYLHCAVLVTDNFDDNTLDGWVGTNIDYYHSNSTGRDYLLINSQGITNKNYNFGSYFANMPIIIKIKIFAFKKWNESFDYFRISKDGNPLSNYTYNDNDFLEENISTTLDINGRISLALHTDTNDSIKQSYIDYITIDSLTIPPTANAGADQIVSFGNDVTLDGSSSHDSDGSITDFTWREAGTVVGTGKTPILSGLSLGTHIILLSVTDNSGATATDTVNIHINGAPVADAGPDQNITLGDTVTIDGSRSTDDNTSSLTYYWTEGSIPVNENSVSPTITISTAGTYTITLTVTDDGGLTSTDTVFIRVNTPPEIEDLNLTILKNSSLSVELNATDVDGDTIVSYSTTDGPSHGTLTLADNNLTYTPDTNYTGTDFFTYKAYDGIDYSNTATFTIDIVPKAQAIHDDFNTTYRTPLKGNVLDNDKGYNITLTDFNLTRDNNLTSICNLSQDFNGSLNISSDGDFVYYPEDRLAGNVGFYYTITDDFNYTSRTNVCITVYPPNNDLSIVKSAPTTVDGGEPIDYTLTVSSAANNTYISAFDVIVSDTLPDGVLFNGVTSSDVWTCSEVGGTVSCGASSIMPGYSDTITIHAFAPRTLTTITNTATIDSSTPDPDRTNNSSTAITNVQGQDVDLTITKTVSSNTIKTTEPFFYTLSVSNIGTASASSVLVTDTLPSQLEFISIDAGADWVCGQGNTINCDYIANSGIFPANSTSNDIVIYVRAPSIEGVITNSADVKTKDTIETNITHNTSSVDINVTTGTIKNIDDTNLSKYLQYNIYGDYSLIANTNINFPGDTDPNANYNDDLNMTYVDTDSRSTTYNSSSSRLTVPDGYRVLWAGLFWEGRICQEVDDENHTRCIWKNSTYNDYADAQPYIGQVQFKTPSQDYQVITANTLNTIDDPNNYTPYYLADDMTYSALTDVTDLVKEGGSGVYSVADIVLTEGDVAGGNYGGWSMITIYENPNPDENTSYKNISVFTGFQYINENNESLTVTGFLTPLSGDVNASLAFFAADGDPVDNGTIQMENKDNIFRDINNSVNPVNNILNSTMTIFGKPINPGVTKTYGVDADRIDVSTFMKNGQTEAKFLFHDSTPDRVKRDSFTLSMFTFATDLPSPIIDDLIKRAFIIDKDGTRRQSAPDQPIYPASKIEYTITFTNTGAEIAKNVEIFDDFDYDGLSSMLDVNHFDTTQLKLFKGSDTTDEIANPNCGYNLGDRRVYCSLNSVAIDASYTMQFVVSVKDQIATADINTSAVNTAYAKYRNPNDNTYVIRGTTPAPESEPIGGKSNTLNAGYFVDYISSTEKFIKIKAINKYFNYDEDRNITTKLVNTTFDLQLVHLDKDGNNNGYLAYTYADGNTKPLNVLLSLSADILQVPIQNSSNIIITEFDINDRTSIAQGLMIPKAYKNTKLKINYLDWHTILGWAKSNSSCLTENSSAVYHSGLPSCFSVYHYVAELMPKTSFPDVANCYTGEGNISRPTGIYAPCDIRAYDLQGNPFQSISPKIYEHSYGCFHCISDASPNFYTYSQDDFAVRPVRFDLDNKNSPSYPDLLRAGLDYNLSLEAHDGLSNSTQDYNVSKNELRTYHKKVLPDESEDTQGILEGEFNISTSANYKIRNGVSVPIDSNNSDTVEEVIDIIYDNIGKLSISLYDPHWADVDIDDTPLLECNDTASPTRLHDEHTPIETGRTICSNELNITYIPHHFDVNNTTLSNHSATGGFTYLANEIDNMSAHITTKISAMNAKGKITTNFKKDAYEHSITVDVNVTDWNTTLANDVNASRPQQVDTDGSRLDTNINVHDISDPSSLGFGTNTDDNGTRTIITNEINTETRLYFNYARDNTVSKNPFIIQGRDVNISVSAKYTGTADEASADINGTGIGNNNATFYYARIRSAKAFYAKVTDKTKQTPILIDVYCDLGYEECENRGIRLLDAEINEPNWWLSLRHSMNGQDGNVTLSVATTNGSINKTSVNIENTDGEDENITVGRTQAPLLVDINLNDTNPADTSSWLIYNYNNPLYQVEFIGDSGWTGHGKTGNVVDSQANKNENRRLGW